MYLLGIAGKKRSGKDTVCKLIQELIPHRRIEKLAFADALKKELADATGQTVEFINNNKEIFRAGLQWWGTEFRRGLFGDKYWIQKWLDGVVKMDGNVWMVIVPDVRFYNEAKTIVDAGGWMLHVKRTSLVSSDTHQSETEMGDNYNYNEIIYNDGSIEDLKGELRKLIGRFGLYARL